MRFALKSIQCVFYTDISEITVEINTYTYLFTENATMALISNMAVIVSSQREHKVHKLHFQGLKITPKAMEFKCYHSR